MVCKQCGKEFEPKKRGRKNTGFCSKSCADKYRYKNKPALFTKQCEHCGVTFTTKVEGQRFCSKGCSSKSVRADFETKTEVVCPICGRAFTATEPSQKCCSSICSGVMRGAYHHVQQMRRRSQMNDSHGRLVDLRRLYLRDKGVCGVCGLPVPFDNDPENIWGATRDHIVPLAVGGEHTYGNCQLAHRICNSLKYTSGENYKIDWEKMLAENPERWKPVLADLENQLGAKAKAV